MEGRTYHWYTNHQVWTLYKGPDCNYKPIAMENTIEEAVTEKEEDNESTKRPSYSQALKSLLTVTDDSDSEEEWFYLSMFRIFSIMEFILSLLQEKTYNYVFSLVLYIFFIYTMTKIVQNKCNKAMR